MCNNKGIFFMHCSFFSIILCIFAFKLNNIANEGFESHKNRACRKEANS